MGEPGGEMLLSFLEKPSDKKTVSPRAMGCAGDRSPPAPAGLACPAPLCQDQPWGRVDGPTGHSPALSRFCRSTFGLILTLPYIPRALRVGLPKYKSRWALVGVARRKATLEPTLLSIYNSLDPPLPRGVTLNCPQLTACTLTRLNDRLPSTTCTSVILS